MPPRTALSAALALSLALAACGADDDDAAATTTTTATTAPAAACSAAGLPAEPEPAPQLPPAVADMRAAIVEAAVACDYDALGELALEGGTPFIFSFGDNTDPAAHWRQAEQDGAGDGPLRFLVGLLDRPFATQEIDGATQYAWPSAYVHPHWDDVPEADREALKPLYTEEDFERFAAFGGYIGYRVGISDGGDWRFFVAGD